MPAVIAGYARSPFTPSKRGALARTRPDDIAATVVNGLIRETGVDPSLIEDLIVGTAFPEAEQGFNVARMITFLTDLPETVPGVTINRFCGSSMQAIHTAAGAIAKKILKKQGVSVHGFVSEIGQVKADSINHKDINNKYFFCDESKLADLDSMFKDLIDEGNSVGAKLGVVVENCPVGLGDPVFEKLDANLAKAIMTINAVKSVSIGNADDLLNLKGSEARDEMTSSGYASNNSGGILGGISNGDDISLSFIIKPTSSIKSKGKTVNKDGEEVDIEVTGRHDPCVGIRAVPIAEAMVSLVLVDHLLINRAQCAEVKQELPFSE